MMDYTAYTNEELIKLIAAGEENAYTQLFYNLKPVILHECEMYRGRMETCQMEDFFQEAMIVCWQLISRNRYDSSKGRFSTLFATAYRRKLINIFRDYTLKNYICIQEDEDSRGNITRILVEADYAKEYRIRKAAQQKRWREKKKAAQPSKEKKPPMTREERSRKVMAYQKKYYAEHPDKLAKRREKNRIAEKKRRDAKKDARLAEETQQMAAMA